MPKQESTSSNHNGSPNSPSTLFVLTICLHPFMYVVLIAAAVRENRGEREGEEVGESKKERNADTKGSERKAKPSDSWIRLMDDFPLQ